MNWEKKGRLLQVNHNFDWMHSYASIPIYYPLDNDKCRIYFSTRNQEGKSYPAYAVLDTRTWKVNCIHDKPLLSWGRPGTFDDSGVMFSSIVPYKNSIYAYYIGWNQGRPASYHLSIGLAISEDNGETFKKYSDGPLLDRDLEEPIFNTAPWVIHEAEEWKMWYVSCTHWINGEEKMEPVYYVKYATSKDGIRWKRRGGAIDYKSNDEAIGRPCVLKENGIYKMWYSSRKTLDYRKNKDNIYRIGYACSKNGVNWIRKDDEVGITVSEKGWDSEMLCYCNVFMKNNQKHLLYNGNNFGKTGFGLAVWGEKEKCSGENKEEFYRLKI